MMKTYRISLAALGAAVALAAPAARAADVNTSYGDTKTASTGSTAEAKQPSQKLQDGLQKLHAVNKAEIDAGQLAEQSGSSQQVKDFGKQMVSEHTMNDAHLSQMAQAAGLNLEGQVFEDQQKKAQDHMKSLQGKTGADFDQAYMAAMVKGHQAVSKEVKTLTDEARKEKLPTIAAALQSTEQMVNRHLTQAKSVETVAKNEAKAAKSGGTGAASPK
jgi:putative membrane protein